MWFIFNFKSSFKTPGKKSERRLEISFREGFRDLTAGEDILFVLMHNLLLNQSCVLVISKLFKISHPLKSSVEQLQCYISITKKLYTP